jgi:hypothetical protein
MLFWGLMETLDSRYQIRTAFRRKTRRDEKGGRWFYSSYVNFTRALVRHLPRFEGETIWAVNRYDAAREIPPEARWYYLCEFGKPTDGDAKKDFIRNMKEHFAFQPEEKAGFPLQSFTSCDADVAYLLNRLLPASLAETDLLYSFLQQTSPEILWVADQWGSENLLLQVARTFTIPAHQVQHGVLHRFFPFSPLYSDRFWVWGDFWKRALPEREREKVQVVNPGLALSPAKACPEGLAKKTILFLTSPIHLGILWNRDMVLQEFVRLLEGLLGNGHAALVRVHPAEALEFWRNPVERKFGRIPPGVSFSKEEPLTEVLEKTDLAVMFFSTVFLNCLASGIPVMALRWYPHIWMEPLAHEGLIHMGQDIGEVLNWVDTARRAPGGKMKAEKLLAPNPPGENR